MEDSREDLDGSTKGEGESLLSSISMGMLLKVSWRICIVDACDLQISPVERGQSKGPSPYFIVQGIEI